MEKEHKLDDITVTEEDIAHIVATWTGIPVRRLEENESERLLNMEEILHKRVIGQDEAVEAIARAIRRARAGLKDPSRPIGSFIFLDRLVWEKQNLLGHWQMPCLVMRMQ